jgi:ATP phosphoribosyltransferase regulatory subunit
MSNLPHRALLPAGFHDILPPDAAHRAHAAEQLVTVFASYGYERVEPPLVEFEGTLLFGMGAAMAEATFRLVDPISQHMMGVRADMTLQAARIATSRLSRSPRPLRLAYAGPVLRASGARFALERQVTQTGLELIGAPQPSADAEVILVAVEALSNLGVTGLSLDFSLPTLVSILCQETPLPPGQAIALRYALDRKDAAAVMELGGRLSSLLSSLLKAGGPADSALAAVASLDLPSEAASLCDRLAAVATLVNDAAPNLGLTIDFVEHRGFEYHVGISFTLFACGQRSELGRGGRYVVEGTEAATGFTIFLDSILQVVPRRKSPTRVYLPFGTPTTAGISIRASGQVTIAGLAPESEGAMLEAKRLGCSLLYAEDRLQQVS